jgi:Family of unknown function (DUF6223)
MSVRHLISAVDAALLGGVGLTEPAVAQVSVAAGVIGSGRLVPIVAAVVGLIGVVIGGLALARSTGRIGTGNGRRGAIVAGVAGLIGVVVSGLHLANSTGGFGTGNGRAGAIVAAVVGLIGMVLAGLALVRSRRIDRQNRGLGVTK